MKKIILIFITLLFLNLGLMAQSSATDKVRSKNFPKFPKIVNTNIPGAPVLGQPFHVNGKKQEIRVDKHGLAYPAFYDWNKDGKKDLLLGEFESGDTGSNIKVYLNEGSNRKPKFSGEYFYALDTKGDTITTHQW